MCDPDGRVFYCSHCGTEDHGELCDEWKYSYLYANGRAYICPVCGKDSIQDCPTETGENNGH